jgi:hypothetical protein
MADSDAPAHESSERQTQMFREAAEAPNDAHWIVLLIRGGEKRDAYKRALDGRPRLRRELSPSAWWRRSPRWRPLSRFAVFCSTSQHAPCAETTSR